MSASTYLNTAACGLVSEEIAATGIEFIRSLSQNASISAEHWRDISSIRIRKNIADFLEAPVQNIAMIPNFSFGMNGIVQALKGTETILLFDQDYPSLINPFLTNNFKISFLRSENHFNLAPEYFEQKLKTEKIDILAISHVQWLSGALVDIQQIINICHRNQVRVIVDATQSLGAMPISVTDLQPDVLIASNYKWMNAGFGTGILYISDSFIHQFPPRLGGVHSYETTNGHRQRTASALDFEPGHTNMAGFSILDAAIADKQKRGLSAIEHHNQRLTSEFVASCAELPISLVGPQSMSGRCSIVVLKDNNGLSSWLKKHQFTVTQRNETIRLGFHYYNNTEDVQRLIDCIHQFPNK